MVGTVFGAGEQARKQASKQAGRQAGGRQAASKLESTGYRERIARPRRSVG